ncbi:hypothetical protein NDU88_007691 [Pleurodeles waltl]|uniref:Uncharacterized protein n=1 Tax=Pleurodeles waltl TaxID=8319 RepID=A0AAV7NAY1_PLEWA|nr:hypothetical protein NDU88_007691 [Pleurodeles waltl]
MGENSGRATICPAPGVGGTGRTKVAARAVSPETQRPNSGRPEGRLQTPHGRQAAPRGRCLSGLESEMVGGQLLQGCSRRIGSGFGVKQSNEPIRGSKTAAFAQLKDEYYLICRHHWQEASGVPKEL